MRVVPRKSDPSMFRDASRSRFACFADQILSLDLPSSSDMHTSPTTLSARRKCDQKQADRVTDQVEDSPPRVVVLFVSGPLVPDFRAVDIRFGLALTHSLTHSPTLSPSPGAEPQPADVDVAVSASFGAIDPGAIRLSHDGAAAAARSTSRGPFAAGRPKVCTW